MKLRREFVVTTWLVRGKQFHRRIFSWNVSGMKSTTKYAFLSILTLIGRYNFSGGLSNFLYYVSLPDEVDACNNVKSVKRARKDTSPQEPKEVLLRIYGQTHGEQALETVLTDTVVFTLLSERKLGPKLHGIFPGGRIEQYIPVSTIVDSNQVNIMFSIKVAIKRTQ